MRVTISAPLVFNEYGQSLPIGTVFTTSTEYGTSLVRALKALDTDGVLGAGVVAASRSALATDNGGTFGLRSGATYTISSALLIPDGVILTAGASGGGTIAVGGSVTINGGAGSIALTARQVAVVLPTDGTPTDLTVKVS